MLLNLLKKEFKSFKSTFSGGNSKKTSIATKIITGIAVAVSIFYIIAISTNFSYTIIRQLNEFDLADLALVLAFIGACSMNIVYTIARSSSILFSFKDYDLLVSLPISIRTIITSKLIFLYLSNLILQSIIMIPNIIVWIVLTEPSMQAIINVIIAYPFVGLIPVVVASILGMIVSAIAAMFKKPALLTSLISILFACGIIVASMFIGNTNAFITDNLNSIADVLSTQITSYYPPALYYYELIQLNYISLAIFIGISVISYILFIYICNHFFIKIRSKLVTTGVNTYSKNIKIKNASAFKSLFIKELHKLIDIPIYAMNSVFTPILGVIGIIYLFINQDQISIILAIEEQRLFIQNLIPLGVSFLVGFTTTSCASLSLEGSNLWLLKTLPYKAIKVLNSFALFNVIINLPFALIFGLTAIYFLNLDIYYSIIVIVFPIAMCLYSSYVGILLNIKFPNFDWDNPAVVVKRSGAVMALAFSNMAIFIAISTPLIRSGMNSTYGLILYSIGSIIFLIIALSIYLYLRANAKKILTNL